MNTVKVRHLELGTGIPAICIPNTGKTKEEILSLTSRYLASHMDIMEWRTDWFEHVDDTEAVLDVLTELRALLGDTPLLCTFRTTREGGVHKMSTDSYIALNKAVAASGMADLIDVEIFSGDDVVNDLITAIHASGVKAIASNHDFDKTPAKADIISRLCKMQDMGADILKIAVMPRSKKDVLTLLTATEEMTSDHANRPIITMSMSGLGSISRLSCELFGSCLTFGSGSTASAPGQIDSEKLYTALHIIHDALT